MVGGVGGGGGYSSEDGAEGGDGGGSGVGGGGGSSGVAGGGGGGGGYCGCFAGCTSLTTLPETLFSQTKTHLRCKSSGWNVCGLY